MKKVQVRELQKILTEHISILKTVRIQNVNYAIYSGDLQNDNYKEFISNTDKRISKAKNLLSSITGEFNLVDEPEEEEVV